MILFQLSIYICREHCGTKVCPDVPSPGVGRGARRAAARGGARGLGAGRPRRPPSLEHQWARRGPAAQARVAVVDAPGISGVAGARITMWGFEPPEGYTPSLVDVG